MWPSIIKTHCSLISSVYHHWCNIWISLPASNCVYAHKSQFKVLKQSVSPTYHCLPHPDFLYKSHLHHIINASSAHCQYKSYHFYSFPKEPEPSFTKTKIMMKKQCLLSFSLALLVSFLYFTTTLAQLSPASAPFKPPLLNYAEATWSNKWYQSRHLVESLTTSRLMASLDSLFFKSIFRNRKWMRCHTIKFTEIHMI